MEPCYPISRSPRRLSERRGLPKLQPLEPTMPSKCLYEASFNPPRSNDSSIPSILFPDAFDTPALSTPATPTDLSPLRVLGAPCEGPSAFMASSIREEEEGSEYECVECSACGIAGGVSGGLKVNGLGLSVDELERRELQFPRRLEVASPDQAHFDESCYEKYQFDSKLAPFTMPPTPPSQSGERRLCFSGNGFPALSPQEKPGELIDHEAFSSSASSLPQSPTSDSSTSVFGKSRTATILSKVVPAKIRASIKRRISNPNGIASHPAPIPPVPTMPAMSVPSTPPDEFENMAEIPPSSAKLSPKSDNFIAVSSEAMLPPLHALSSVCPEPEALAHQSPTRSAGPSLDGAEVFPQMSCATLAAELVVSSPLHPPTISPLVSPSLASASQTSLNTSLPTQPVHKKIPSIDPATPVAPKKLTAPITVVTPDSLADMFEEMKADLAAYDATRARMIESGWSSPQEIRNVELQRKDKEATWKSRIAESKRILESIKRYEVKHSAMSSVSSVSSFDSIGSSVGYSSNGAPQLHEMASGPNVDVCNLCKTAISDRAMSR